MVKYCHIEMNSLIRLIKFDHNSFHILNLQSKLLKPIYTISKNLHIVEENCCKISIFSHESV